MLQPRTAEQAKPISILLVEDDPLIRAMVAEELRDAGLGVIEAANADEAWDYVVSASAPDLVFADVQMPGSMDGIELIGRLRGLYPEIPAILTSGNRGADVHQGLARFIEKPYQISHLTAIIRKTLEAAGS